MATDATRNLRPSRSAGRPVGRVAYDVRSSCIGIGVSILALAVLLLALALL
ncbi:hypothetical protein ACPXB3_18295 [Gordonia sp. DT219]|uniref:hypothetical protein n=1 Tax=unclassified Gordonia (in: high G+C Gram-positive bacteria) TaxID=2657482 RepID=UPI003CEDD31A